MGRIREIIDSLDGDELCKYCRFGNEGCEGGVKRSPSGPIYPPCCEGLDENDFDLESYLQDVEDGEI